MRTASMHQLFGEINGIPTYVETVQSTGTAATSTGFANSSGAGLTAKGIRFLLQPDADCYIKVGAVGSTGMDGIAVTAVTAANGLRLSANEKFYLCMNEDNVPTNGIPGHTRIQVISVAGTVNLKLFRLD